MRTHAAIVLILVSVTLALYWPATGFDFVRLDDPDNVTLNPLVTNGLTPGNLVTAFTTRQPDYWRPLCWLTYMVDTELFGTGPRGYHLSNIIYHALATALLYLALALMTGRPWLSGFVAAGFALHPMHVESVAWITERKDVLSAVFFSLTLLAYTCYGRGPNLIAYIATLVCMAMGLMSKSMLVTLPCVLLLLDLWPLNRLRMDGPWRDRVRCAGLLALEKVPMLAMSAVVVVMTMQSGDKAIMSWPLRERAANAIVSFVRYASKFFVPTELVVYYPYPGMLGEPAWTMLQIVGSFALLLIISLIVIWQIKRRPWLLVGWLLFIGMLMPVIGILQVGNQGLADRFTYLPYIGLLIMLAWSLAEIAGRWKTLRWPMASVAIILLATWGFMTARHLPVWASTDSLYGHALRVHPSNWKMREFVGNQLLVAHRWSEAVTHLQFAADVYPEHASTRYKLGLVLAKLGRNSQARREFEAVIEREPNHAAAHYNLGVVLVARGERGLAAREVRRAIELASLPEVKREYEAALREIESP